MRARAPLVSPRAWPEKVPHLGMDTAKALRGLDTLTATPGTRAVVNAALVLRQVIIHGALRPVAHGFAELGFESSRIGRLAIPSAARRATSRDGTRGADKRGGGGLGALLTQQASA